MPNATVKIENVRFILTLDPGRRIIRDGSIIVEGSRITQVGKATDLKDVPADRVIDGSEMVATPGFINGPPPHLLRPRHTRHIPRFPGTGRLLGQRIPPRPPDAPRGGVPHLPPRPHRGPQVRHDHHPRPGHHPLPRLLHQGVRGIGG